MVSLGVGVGKDVEKDCSDTCISNVLSAGIGMKQVLAVISVKEERLDIDKQLSKQGQILAI